MSNTLRIEDVSPTIRRVRQDLYFVEWGNVRFGGTFSELYTFAQELKTGMTKAIAGDPEKRLSPTAYTLGRSHTCPKCEHSNLPCPENRRR
jgi:hypothetical protein